MRRALKGRGFIKGRGLKRSGLIKEAIKGIKPKHKDLSRVWVIFHCEKNAELYGV